MMSDDSIWNYPIVDKVRHYVEKDIDYAYKDYPSIIKSRGLNGFKRPIPDNPKGTITVTAEMNNKIYKGTLTET